MKITQLALLAGATLIANTAARAHYLWIEQPATGNAIVHFGEYNEGVIERSPGRMDEMPSIEAFAGQTPLKIAKQASHFTLSAKSAALAVTAQELDYPVKDWRTNGIGLAKPMYYARFAPASATAAATPLQTLDILPATDRKSVQVWLHGKPLAGASVALHARNGWTKSDKADGEGRLNIAMPWRGQYVVEVIHAERLAGSFGGAAYDVIRHRATLTLVQPIGPVTFAVVAPSKHD